MQSPKKLHAHNLRNVILEIHYEPAVSLDLLLGAIYTVTKTQGYDYNNNGVFGGKAIVFSVQQDSMIFRCVEKGYSSWLDFSTPIKNILQKLIDESIVERFYRFRLRYVNFFENTPIKNVINNDIQISLPNFSEHYALQWQNKIENGLIHIALANQKEESSTTSIIDISAKQDIEEGNIYEKVVKALEFSHEQAKASFFSLISQSALEKMNPEY